MEDNERRFSEDQTDSQLNTDALPNDESVNAQVGEKTEEFEERSEKEAAPGDAVAENADATDNEEMNIVASEESEMVAEEEELPPIYHWNYETQRDTLKNKEKKKRRHGAFIYAVIMTCAFITSFVILTVILLTNDFVLYTEEAPSVTNTGETEKIVYIRDNTNESGALSSQEIYSSTLPSVVSILAYSQDSAASGSGFIISSDGYIATANHVVDGMSQLTVILNNGEKYGATVVGGNEFTDLALIKIEKTGLPAVKIGKSSDLLVGDKVFAIGSPASVEFAGSMTEGIVSYNNRVLSVYNESGAVEKRMTVIQTDALLNPGNSGCPIFNSQGEVIGIVSMKLNSTYYDAICFAIPTDAAMPIINAMKDGKDYSSLLSAVSRYPARLGISGENVQMTVNSQNVYGVKITSFTSSEYDIASKMKVGDIIVKVESTTVTSVQDISDVLAKYQPGDEIRISFYRSTQLMTYTVKLGK